MFDKFIQKNDLNLPYKKFVQSSIKMFPHVRI